MFTEQFSQHGFKVQIACVNLEILRTAQKGERMSVLSLDAVAEGLGATSYLIVVIIFTITISIFTISISIFTIIFITTLPLLGIVYGTCCANHFIGLCPYGGLQDLTFCFFSVHLLAYSSLTTNAASLQCLTIPDTFSPQDLCTDYSPWLEHSSLTPYPLTHCLQISAQILLSQ